MLITVKASNTPADFRGTFSFTQVINSSRDVSTPSPPGKTCVNGPGLDGQYVTYSYGLSLNDSPSVPANSSLSEVKVSDSFSSYLMWTPSGMASSIAIPLGHFDWGWSADATRDQSTGIWSSTGTPTPATMSPLLTFPTWSANVYPPSTGTPCQ